MNEPIFIDFNLLCPCGKKFDNIEKRNNHQKCHDPNKLYVCKNPGCYRGYQTQGTLNRHQKKCQLEEKEFKCLTCGKEFKYKSSLTIHNRRHEKIYSVKCNQRGCKKTFTNLALRNYHIKKAHIMILKANQNGEENQKAIQCDHKDCGKKFDTIRLWEIHHNRYSKYCAAQKHKLRSKLGKTKTKLKQMRKQNLMLKKILLKSGQNYEKELKKMQSDKFDMQNIDQIFRDDDSPVNFDFQPSSISLNDSQKPMRGLQRYNQQRQQQKIQGNNNMLSLCHFESRNSSNTS
ncbi:zinc finger protein 175 [Stylonychia lemnae]|uniref:Zinc finger protein 175 n=1 Tax=Stylonychia lemnae TaxID=5949 RepID=A0A078AEC3_STYLE|nr:zinc finger protein 175 [Stylonychia lemnae]|eukprot:CDW80186.1 zinc finger protein 175 [Stylonychia lemnae]